MASLDEMIREFVALDRQARDAYARKRELAMSLADIAWREKGEKNTVHLRGENGLKLKVEFRTDLKYDNEQLMEVSRMLGAEQFDQLFSAELKFTAKRRNLNAFLSTVYTDEKRNTAKVMIKDAVIETEPQPYVSVEVSSERVNVDT